MVISSTQVDLQYMRDVGVPGRDVDWLQAVLNAGENPIRIHPERAGRIDEMAYDGLMATVKNNSPAIASILQA